MKKYYKDKLRSELNVYIDKGILYDKALKQTPLLYLKMLSDWIFQFSFDIDKLIEECDSDFYRRMINEFYTLDYTSFEYKYYPFLIWNNEKIL